MAKYIGLDFSDLLANQGKFNIDETRLFRKMDFPPEDVAFGREKEIKTSGRPRAS